MGDGSVGGRLWIGLLGPVEVRVGGHLVAVPGPRRRTLLAALALSPRRVLGVERLIDLTWPNDPPQDAVQALYNHVSRLRADLGAAGYRVTRHDAGYSLDIDDDDLDVARVRLLAGDLSTQPPTTVLERAGTALGLWRGLALEEFRSHHLLGPSAVSLDDLRTRLEDDLLQARLDVGDADVVPDAVQAARAHPLRERTVLLLVRALASDGQTAEAMAAAAAYRNRLVDETGLDAGPALAALQQQVATGAFAPTVPPSRAAGAGGVHRLRVARPSGPLVGRERDRNEVLRLLRDHRLVTLTGAGGVGKTTLAVDVAAEIVETEGIDAAVVDLAAVDEAARVAQAVATSLRLRTGQRVTADDVASTMGDGPLLVVLDNCEHVAEATRRLVETVAARVPGVRFLCTSRVTLHARGEYVVRLHPLPVPDGDLGLQALERQPSVQAFLAHARRHEGSFALRDSDVSALLDLLTRLDGLPLAIEIAAGHATMLPIPILRDRLALDLATVGSASDDERQATLRAAIGWSYDMLSAPEQALLLAVAPFPGGVDLATVELLAREATPDVDPVHTLHRLHDASLVDVDSDRSRYRLLFTVRQFLLEELRRTDAQRAAESRFIRWAVLTAQQVGRDLAGPQEQAADRRLRNELDNLRAARDLARARGEVDAWVDITLAADVPAIWRDVREVWAWCLEAAEDPVVEGHAREAEVLGAAAEAARLTGAYDRAVALAQRGLDRAAGRGSAAVRCESALAGVAHYRGDFEQAARRWEVAARTASGTRSAYLASAALATAYAGDVGQALALLRRARDEAEQTRCASNLAFATYVSGEVAALSDRTAAIPLFESAITQARAVGATFVQGVAAVALASARTTVGDSAVAAAAFAELLDTWQGTGQGPQLWTTARNAAALLAAEGRPREAALLGLHADASPDAAVVDPEIAGRSGRVYLAVEELVDAEQLASLRAEALAMSAREVVDVATRALRAIATADRSVSEARSGDQP